MFSLLTPVVLFPSGVDTIINERKMRVLATYNYFFFFYSSLHLRAMHQVRDSHDFVKFIFGTIFFFIFKICRTVRNTCWQLYFPHVKIPQI
jgi:hypothetical protein